MSDPVVTMVCPICGKPAVEPKYKPFCCVRCADVDLHRWLGGVYRVETSEVAEESEERSPAPNRG